MKLQLKTAIERTSCAFASGCEFCLVNWTPCPVYLKTIPSINILCTKFNVIENSIKSACKTAKFMLY